MKKRLLSAILVLAMVLSLMPATVFADTQYSVLDVAGTTDAEGNILPDGEVKYISLGESMTNGYGTEGYYPGYVFAGNNFVSADTMEDWSSADRMSNTFGWGRTEVTTYASLFEKFLEEEYAVEVNWEPWAISGQRPEDFYWLMQEDWCKFMDAGKDENQTLFSENVEGNVVYNGDMYTTEIWKNGNKNENQVSRFIAAWVGRWSDTLRSTIRGTIDRNTVVWTHSSGRTYYNSSEFAETYLSNFRDEYIEAIKTADIISVNLGTHCFSANVSSVMLDVLSGSNNVFEDPLRATPEAVLEYCDANGMSGYRTIYEQINSIINAKLAPYMGMLGEGGDEKLEKIMDIYSYATLSFLVTYDLSLQRIRELNPEAEIVVLGMTNFQEGLCFDLEGTIIDFGDLFGALVDFTNLYRAAWVEDAQDSIYVPNVPDMHLLIDEFADVEAGGEKDADDGVDDIKIDIVYLTKIVVSLSRSWDFPCAPVNEFLGNETNQILAVEYLYTGVMPEGVSETQKAGLLLVEKVYKQLQEVAGVEDFDGTAGLRILAGETLDMSSALSGLTSDEGLDEAAQIAAHLWIRCFMGEGVGCHPSITGHKQVYEVMKANWKENYTGEKYLDEQKPELIDLLKGLMESDEMSDADKVEMIGELYGMMKEKNVVDEPMLGTLEKLYNYLDKHDYITDKQSVEILIEIFAAIKDDEVTDDEMLNLIKVCVKVLGENDEKELTATDKVNMIGNIYTILEEDGFLEGREEMLAPVVEIYDCLDPHMDDDQTIRVAKVVYNALIDEELTDEETLNISNFIIEVLGEKKTGDEAMTAEEKVDVIGKVYGILEKYEYLEGYDELQVVEDLNAVLMPHMTAEQSAQAAKMVYNAIVDDKAVDDDEIMDITDYLIEELGKNNMSAADKVDVIGKVYGILKTAGYLKDYADQLTVLEDLYECLAPYMNDEQAAAAAKAVFNAIIDDKALDNDEMMEVTDFIVNTLGKDMTATDKVTAIGKVYTVLEKAGYLTGYAEKLDLIEALYECLDPYMDDEQTAKVAKYVYETFTEGEMTQEKVLDAADFIINTLGKDMDATDKVTAIGKVYTVLEEKTDYLDGYAEDLAVFEVLYKDLSAAGNITDEQSIAIAKYAYEAAADGVTDAEKEDIAKYIYEVLRDSSDADRIAVIGKAYTVLTDNGYLNLDEKTQKAVDTVEEIYDFLNENKYIDDEKAMAIVDEVYAAIEDGELSDDEMMDIAKFTYDTLVADLGDSDKIEVIGKVYEILKADYNLGEVSEIAMIEEIYDYLDENKYITDEQAADIVDYVYDVVSDGNLTDDDTANIAVYIYNVLNSNEDLEFADKLAIVQFIYNTLVKYEYIDEITLDDIYAYLVDKGLEEAVDELKAVALAKAKEYAEETNPMLKAAVAELDAEINELNEELMALKAELEKKLVELEAATNSADKAVLATVDQLKDTIATLEASIKEIEEDIEVLEQTIADLEAAIEDVTAEIEALIEAVEAMDEAVRNVNKVMESIVDLTVDGALTTANSAIEIAMEAVDLALVVYERGEVLVCETVDLALLAYDKALEIGKEILTDAVVAYYSLPEAVRAEIEATLSDATKQAIAELEAQHEQIQADIMAQYNEYAPKVLAEIERLNKELEEAHDEYVPIILAEIDRLNAELEAKYNEIKEAVIAQYLAQVEIVENLIEGKIDEAVAALEDLQAQIAKQLEIAKAEFEKAYIEATTDSYTPNANSYYVAIGDASAAGESYVDIVAERLDVEFNNLSDDELLDVMDAFAIVEENKDEIAKADLITVGFTNNSFMNAAINEAMGYGEGIDWAKLVGDEAAGYVAEAMELIDAEILKAVGDKTTAEMLSAAIEAYAYSCSSYAYNMPMLVNEIREINADACVVLVGMYNPLENQVLEMNGQSIEIGEYMEYLTKAAGIHGLGYAMLTSNGTFVAAPAVETIYEAEGGAEVMDVMALINEYVRNWGENFLPSEDGHVYIADQIINAILNKALWGDANGDGVVNAKDAMLVLQYYVKKIDASKLNTAVCDVDGNGAINAKDAMLILQKYVKKIAYFPVEVA